MISLALEAVPTALMVLGEGGTIEYANGAAAQLLRQPALFTIKGGCLAAVAGDPRSWSAAVRHASRYGAAVLAFTAIQPREAIHVVARLRHIGAIALFRGVWPTAEHLASIEIRGVAERRAALNRLAHRCRLTAAELRVLELLAEGGKPREIAASLGVGVSTVRSHLHSLYSKTGARCQGHLIRLFMP